MSGGGGKQNRMIFGWEYKIKLRKKIRKQTILTQPAENAGQEWQLI